jgi:hypothetical protein
VIVGLIDRTHGHEGAMARSLAHRSTPHRLAATLALAALVALPACGRDDDAPSASEWKAQFCSESVPAYARASGHGDPGGMAYALKASEEGAPDAVDRRLRAFVQELQAGPSTQYPGGTADKDANRAAVERYAKATCGPDALRADDAAPTATSTTTSAVEQSPSTTSTSVAKGERQPDGGSGNGTSESDDGARPYPPDTSSSDQGTSGG